MKTYNEKERFCELTFQNCMPCWHAYTCGKDTPILFANDNDMSFAMNVIAQAAYQFINKVRIIAFEVMNNHFHFVISGDKGYADDMFNLLFRRIRRALSSSNTLSVSYKPIEDLTSMRNHIVYVHRNGYVVNPCYTPFSYPWGTGPCYFSPERTGKLFSEILSADNRQMFRSRDVKLPSVWKVINGYVSPESFCSIDTGMAMFRDAHQYFSAVSKNVEAYSGIAVELDEGEFLTDQELFPKILQTLREKYNVSTIRELTNSQRLDLARSLHFDFRSSNGQIRRVLGLSQFDIDSLFPKSH